MTNRQRINMGPIHPDAQDAVNAVVDIKLAFDGVDVAMMIEEENLSLTFDANGWGVGRSSKREHSCLI